jgi:hypothetical protein
MKKLFGAGPRFIQILPEKGMQAKQGNGQADRSEQ